MHINTTTLPSATFALSKLHLMTRIQEITPRIYSQAKGFQACETAGYCYDKVCQDVLG